MKLSALTGQAEAHPADIAEWTLQTFGDRQADAYKKDLIRRCEQIATGTAQQQSCLLLLADSDTDLRFTRTGQHFIAFIESEDEVIIVDFLNSHSDLRAKISHMMNSKPKPGTRKLGLD